MNATRPLTLVAGIALLGLGAALLVRAAREDEQPDRIGESNPDASVRYGTGTRIDMAFTILRPADELYAYWRRLENLPSIMSHLERVEVVDDLRSRWSAKGPGGFRAEWEAEIIDDRPGHRIAWRSAGGTVPNAGAVTFAAAPGGRGTELHLEMEWTAPGGALGKSFAALFGGDPGLMVETDLLRFKATMEAGYVAVNGTDVSA